jgi:membrane protein
VAETEKAMRPVTELHPLALAKELYKRYMDDQCPAWAAALSFFALLSVVPLLLCGIAALGLAIHDAHGAAEKVFNVLKAALPGENAGVTAQQIVKDAKIEERAEELMNISGVAGTFGLLSLIWAASRIFVNAMPPMNAAFRAPETRGFLQMQLYSIAMLIGAAFLGVLSLLPSYLPEIMRRIPPFTGLPKPTPAWADWLFLTVAVAINVLLFTLIYRFLPSPAAKVTWRQALVGGMTVAVLWEIAKQGFGLYLRNFGGTDSYDKVYGSLGGFVILILWVYYSSVLLLLGAEIAELYADVRQAKQDMAANLTAQSPAESSQ